MELPSQCAAANLLRSAATLPRLSALERCRGDNFSGPARETLVIDRSRWRVRVQRRRLHRWAPSFFRRTRRHLFLAHGLLSRSSPCFLNQSRFLDLVPRIAPVSRIGTFACAASFFHHLGISEKQEKTVNWDRGEGKR